MVTIGSVLEFALLFLFPTYVLCITENVCHCARAQWIIGTLGLMRTVVITSLLWLKNTFFAQKQDCLKLSLIHNDINALIPQSQDIVCVYIPGGEALFRICVNKWTCHKERLCLRISESGFCNLRVNVCVCVFAAEPSHYEPDVCQPGPHSLSSLPAPPHGKCRPL